MKNSVETSYSIRGTNGFKAKENDYDRAVEIATDESIEADGHTFSVVEHYAAKSVVAMIHDGVVFKPEGECDDCTSESDGDTGTESQKSNAFTDIVNGVALTASDAPKSVGEHGSAENKDAYAPCNCFFCQFQRNGKSVQHGVAKQGESRPIVVEMSMNADCWLAPNSPLEQLIKKALKATHEQAPARKPSAVTQALHKIIDQAVIDLYRTLIWYADQAYISGDKDAINEALAELTNFQRFRELSATQQSMLLTKKQNLELRLNESVRRTVGNS